MAKPGFIVFDTDAVYNQDDLSDTVITSVTDNEVLAYDSGTSKWINQTAAEAGFPDLTILASTSNGEGASLIGVEDDGGNYTGTDLETVLTEIADGTTLDTRYVEVAGDTMTGQLKIDYNVSGAGTFQYSLVETGVSAAGAATNVTAYRATIYDGSTAGDTGHVKIGLDVDNTLKHNQVGGDWEDYGIYLDMGSLAEIPDSDYAVNYDLYGAYIVRSSLCVSDALSGSWDDINAYGIYLKGWKGDVPGDDDSGLDNLNTYAIYSDGGNVELTDGNIVTTGTITSGNLILGSSSITMTGSLAVTGSRVTKGWFTDIESTNMPTVGGTSLTDTFVNADGDSMTGDLTTTADIKIDSDTKGLVLGDGQDATICSDTADEISLVGSSGVTADVKLVFEAGNEGYIQWQEDETQFYIGGGGMEISSWLNMGGAFFPRQVDDDAMDATDGTEGEIVYNLDDNKFYGCTATGTPATWAAFH